MGNLGCTLADKFREAVAGSKDFKMKSEKEPDVAYATGLVSFDFLNGSIVHVKSESKNYKYYSVGIVDGSMNMFIGRSGCGKTTSTMQMAFNIAGQYNTSCIFHDDIEGGCTEERKRILSGWDEDQLASKYIGRNTGITAENFYQRIKMIADLKLDNRDGYLYDTGKDDSHGNRIYKLEPTIYILDSLSLLTPEKYADEEELSGQMSGTATARVNASIFRRITPLLKSANIILFIVNHITDAVAINQFDAKPTQVSYLKKGESIPGGKTPVYLCNNIIYYHDASKIKEEEGLGIDGSLVRVSLVKSRQNKSGKFVTMVFDQSRGFDSELSLFIMLKENKCIKGGGAYMYIDGHDDMKFRQKDLKRKLAEEPDFAKVFMDACIPLLKDLIFDVQEDDIFEMEDKMKVSNDILAQMNTMCA